MSTLLRLFFTGSLLFGITTFAAEELTINPFVKGSFNEIRAERQNKPFVLIFWSESCAYCMKELALFGKLQQRFPDIELVTVATDAFLEQEVVEQVLTRSGLALNQTWVFSEQFPEMIYADINKRWRGELPLTYFFGRTGEPIRHMGIVKEEELISWMDEQHS